MNTTRAIPQGEGYCEKAMLYMTLELRRRGDWYLGRAARSVK